MDRAARMRVDYEEKTFEGTLNQELVGASGLLFPPGQVLENDLGIDVGILTHHRAFWRIWDLAPPPMGVDLAQISWIRHRHPAPQLPSYRLNLFLQHKRPEFLSQRNSKEWSHWNKPYFRFAITPHQQATLEAGAKAVGADALVAYSCPALETAAKLFDAIETRTLVVNTNFVEVTRMTGHACYTFSEGGSSGVACSEPVEIEPLLLLDELPERLAAASGDPFLNIAVTATTAMLNAHPSLRDRVTQLADRAREISADLPTDLRGPIRKFVQVTEACYLLGCTWLVAARSRGENSPP